MIGGGRSQRVHESHERLQFRLGKRKGRHAAFRNAVLDRVEQVAPRLAIVAAAPACFDDAGRMLAAAAVGAMTSGAAGFELLLRRLEILSLPLIRRKQEAPRSRLWDSYGPTSILHRAGDIQPHSI